MMAAAREELETFARVFWVFRLGQNSPAAGDDGIGGKNKSAGIFFVDCVGLCGGKAHGEIARHFTLERAFVDFGGDDFIRDDMDLFQ